MAIIVMICFARSGGTLLNRCLGCLPNVVVLSEVNPYGGGWGKDGINSYTTVASQSRQWYGIELKSDTFVGGVLELESICGKQKHRLIVRDWTYVNFVDCAENHWKPPNRFVTISALKDRCTVIPFALIRNSIDVWISRGRPPMRKFFDSYLRYVNALLEEKIKLFKYETLCHSPENTIREICKYSGLRYSPSFKGYSKFTTLNGDVQIRGGSRGVQQGTIGILPRIRIPLDEINKVNRCADMKEANILMGYHPSYYANSLHRWCVNLSSFLRGRGYHHAR